MCIIIIIIIIIYQVASLKCVMSTFRLCKYLTISQSDKLSKNTLSIQQNVELFTECDGRTDGVARLIPKPILTAVWLVPFTRRLHSNFPKVHPSGTVTDVIFMVAFSFLADCILHHNLLLVSSLLHHDVPYTYTHVQYETDKYKFLIVILNSRKRLCRTKHRWKADIKV